MLTHDDLVARAVRWLRGTKKCKSVLGDRESVCWSVSEQADAIGWTAHESFLVECKTSLSDFYADRRKPFRKNPKDNGRICRVDGSTGGLLGGLGQYRYYLCEPGTIPISKINDPWGLLLCLPKIIRVALEAKPNPMIEWAHPERSLLAAKLSWEQSDIAKIQRQRDYWQEEARKKDAEIRELKKRPMPRKKKEAP